MKKRKMLNNESAIVTISDTHIGRWTPSYDIKIAEEKLRFLGHKVIKILSTYHPHIKDVYVVFLGDLVEGENIYPTQTYSLDYLTPEDARRLEAFLKTQVMPMPTVHGVLQSYIAAKFFAEFIINPLISNRYNTTVIGVIGNHGRSGKHNHPLNNLDATCYLFLQLLCDRKPVTCNLQPTVFNVLKVYNWNLLLYHGTRIRMQQTIPFYGILHKGLRWQFNHPFGDIHIHGLLLGHFHTCFYYGGEPKIFVSGTLVEDDLYPIENLGMRGVNRLWLIGVTPTQCPSFHYDLDLSIKTVREHSPQPPTQP